MSFLSGRFKKELCAKCVSAVLFLSSREHSRNYLWKSYNLVENDQGCSVVNMLSIVRGQRKSKIIIRFKNIENDFTKTVLVKALAFTRTV